ncbi:hypothetical protein I3760_04G113700 [Carya illinoinensis]|nr:hypothetical protein I3760_04G113700 [Carya illinoinensis]
MNLKCNLLESLRPHFSINIWFFMGQRKIKVRQRERDNSFMSLVAASSSSFRTCSASTPIFELNVGWELNTNSSYVSL